MLGWCGRGGNRWRGGLSRAGGRWLGRTPGARVDTHCLESLECHLVARIKCKHTLQRGTPLVRALGHASKPQPGLGVVWLLPCEEAEQVSCFFAIAFACSLDSKLEDRVRLRHVCSFLLHPAAGTVLP